MDIAFTRTVSPLKELAGQTRVEEIARAYRTHFDIPFRNTQGAVDTYASAGYPHPMNEAPCYYSTKQSPKCISEEGFTDLVSKYSQEISRLSWKDRTNDAIRDCIVSRLWFAAYDGERRDAAFPEERSRGRAMLAEERIDEVQTRTGGPGAANVTFGGCLPRMPEVIADATHWTVGPL